MSKHTSERRQFLHIASAGTIAAGALASGSAQAAAPTPQVLIIGAGMSGIAAAFWLKLLGISSLVLEAQDRLGGRIHTSTRWPDAPLDLGAAWIHDSRNSPLTPLTRIFNVPTFATRFLPFDMYGLRNQKLPLLDPDPSVAKVATLFGILTVLQQARRQALQAARVPDQPLGNVIDSVLAAMRANPALQIDAESFAGIQSFLDNEYRIHFGVELRELSLYQHDQDKNVAQQHDLAFPGGYVGLIHALNNFAGDRVIRSCVVRRISHGASGVTVATTRGTYSAKYAIVTLPLGVLQRCQGRDPLVQFVPALPPWKLGAINRLKMGVWDKLALRFPPGTAFWGQNQIVRNTVPPSRFTIWFNPLPMLHKDILVPTVFGDLARRIEQTPPQRDADVVALLMNVIRGWFAPQNVRIPDPIDFQRSSWGTNPYAFGCYSHIPPGASGVDYDIMSLPVPFAIPSTRQQRLFFAGEATHRAHCSSVWGAYESGCREALRIACLLGPGSFAQNLIAIGRRKFFGGRLANCVQVWQEYEPQLRVLSTQLTPRRGRI